MAYYIYYASFVNVFNLDGDPGLGLPDLPDVDLGYYLPDDAIEDFLATYLNYSGDTTTSIEQITSRKTIWTRWLNVSLTCTQVLFHIFFFSI